MNQFEQHILEEQRKKEEIARASKEWNARIDQMMARQGGYYNTSYNGGIQTTEWVPRRTYNSMD